MRPNFRDQRAVLVPGRTCAGWCSSATTGPAPPTSWRPSTFQRLGRLDVVPDKVERIQEIATDPYRLAYFLAIRALIGEGHDQYVDDMYTSRDGRLLVVSRPSFADVVAISLQTGEIVWRFVVDGVRVRPHGDLAGRPARGRERVDRRTSCTCCGSATARRSTGSRPAARRTRRLHRRRQADPPRQHRHGLQPARRPARGARRRQASRGLPRWNASWQHPAPRSGVVTAVTVAALGGC